MEIDKQRLDEAVAYIQKQIKISTIFKQFNSYHLNVERGDEKVIHCPFHVDDSPSLNINDTLGKWHCFSCDRGGNVIQAYKSLMFFHKGVKLTYADTIDQLLASTSDRETITFTTIKKSNHFYVDDTFTVRRLQNMGVASKVNMNDIVRWMKKNNKCSFKDIAQVSDFMMEGMSPELILQFLENMDTSISNEKKINVVTAADLLSSIDW